MTLEYMCHHKEAVKSPFRTCPITKRIYSDHLVHIPSPEEFIVTLEYTYHQLEAYSNP